MSDTLTNTIAQLTGQIPTLLVYVVAIVLGSIYWRFHTRSSLFLILGAVVMLLTSIASTIAYSTIPFSAADGGSPENIQFLMSLVGGISSFAFAIGLSLFVAAALVGRRQPCPPSP